MNVFYVKPIDIIIDKLLYTYLLRAYNFISVEIILLTSRKCAGWTQNYEMSVFSIVTKRYISFL